MGPQIAALIAVVLLIIIAAALGWHALSLALAVCGVLSALMFVVFDLRLR